MFDGVDIDKAWIETFSGNKFHILDPRQDEINIIDIAHALSMMCRFTGHVRKFYSVSEHAVHVSRLVPEKDALWGLMHDSSEFAISDMNRPLKHFTPVGAIYRQVEEVVMAAICKKFNLSLNQPESVHIADGKMLWAEKKQLMTSVPWEINEIHPDVKEAATLVKCWSPEIAQTEFLHRFYELTKQL